MITVQCIYGDVPERIQACLDSVCEVYPQVVVYRFPEVHAPLYESDKWRWEFMLEHDDVLYLDWDVRLGGPLRLPDNGLPSFAEYMGQPDNCIMHSPSREIFKKYERERIARGITQETYGWFRKVLRDVPHNCIDGVEHLRVSGMTQLVKQYRSITGETR